MSLKRMTTSESVVRAGVRAMTLVAKTRYDPNLKPAVSALATTTRGAGK